MNSTSNQKGFTLMEIMAVMAVIAIALAFSYGGLTVLLPGNRLDQSAKKIASTTEQLRQDAIVQGWAVTLEYNLDENSYRAFANAPPGKDHEDLADADGRIWLIGSEAIDSDKFIWKEMPPGIELKAVIGVDGDPVEHGIFQIQVQPTGMTDSHALQIYSTDLELWRTVIVNSIFGTAEVVEEKATLVILEDSQFR